MTGAQRLGVVIVIVVVTAVRGAASSGAAGVIKDWKGREPELLMSLWLKKSFDRDESQEFRIRRLDFEFIFGRMDFRPRGAAYRTINGH